MIVEIINNYLGFVRTRSQMVIDEYDEFHQTLQRYVKASVDMDESEKDKLNKFIGQLTKEESDIYGPLINGNEFLAIFKNLVLLNLTQLSDTVNYLLMKRKDLLEAKKEEVKGLFQ